MMKRKSLRPAFTLIEMLVVVVVISILIGLVFKMMRYAKRNQERAACVAKLEKIAFALNEFRAEYGEYPPVTPQACGSQVGVGAAAGVRIPPPPGEKRFCHPKDCRTCYKFPHASVTPAYIMNNWIPRNPTNSACWSFGLVAYLTPILRDQQMYAVTNANLFVEHRETDRDLRAKKKWSHFIEEFLPYPTNMQQIITKDVLTVINNPPITGVKYELKLLTIEDPWDNIIRYRSDPPYQTYKLWSPGPDRYDGDGSNPDGKDTADKAKDNIHWDQKWDE